MKSKIKLVCVFLIVIINCKQDGKLLKKEDWDEILSYGLSFSGPEYPIFHEFLNQELKELVKSSYLQVAEILNYKIDSNLIKKIETRENVQVPIELESFNTRNITKDSTGKDFNVLFLSQPILIINEIVSVSIVRYSKKNKDERNMWAFFYVRNEKSQKLSMEVYYDWEKNTYYESY